MRLSQLHNRVHIYHMAIKVHWDDGFGFGGNLFLDQFGNHVEGLCVYINKNGLCAAIVDRKGSGNIGVANCNGFITRPQLHGF